MSDRITGILTVVLALAFFAGASTLEESFLADPLGPKAFPMLVSVVACIAGVWLAIKPNQEPNWPEFSVFLRLGITLVTLVLYAYMLAPLGFLFSTAFAAGTISYQITPHKRFALITGILMSLGLYSIFRFVLGLSLFAFPRWLEHITIR